MNLSDRHKAMLTASRISEPVIEARGYRTVTDEGELRALGFKPAQCLPGLLIPIHTPDGLNGIYRLRPDNPRVIVRDEREGDGRKKNQVIKYEQPKGAGLRLDCNPLARPSLPRPDVPLWFVEGEKKADALVSAGQCAVSMPGVTAYKSRNEFGGTTFNADFDYITFKARLVRIVFDSDAATNPHVNRAEAMLAEHLRRKGATVIILRLPPADDGAKQGVDDYLAAGHDIDDLLELVDENARLLSMSFNVTKENGLPGIAINGRHLRDISTDALTALENANAAGAYLFVRSGSLARIAADEHGAPKVEVLGESEMRGRMARTANFHKVSEVKGESIFTPYSPPLDVVRDVMALGGWNFPALEAVIECPALRPDGTVLDRCGYDAATRLYYAPGETLRVPEIPEEPSRHHVLAALDLLQRPLQDFPFADDASRANALAALLTPIYRPAIVGCVPLSLIDAPQAGTGKSLLSGLISIIATGHAPSVITAPREEAEWNKSLTSTLQAGSPVVVIDNLTGKLYSGVLASVLTSTIYESRLLGVNEMVKLPNRCTWIANGNNVRLAGDLPRRCYWVRMDALNSRPWQRSGFKIENLTEWTMEHRGELIAAALTLARAWWAAGRPAGSTITLGSFDGWARVLGGVLGFAGVGGFLGNLSAMYEQSDTEGPQWEAFILALKEKFGSQPVTVSSICAAMMQDSELVDVVPEMFDAPLDDKGVVRSAFKQKLGMQLAVRKGTRYGNSQARIIQSKQVEHRASMWMFESDKEIGEAHEAGEAVSGQDALELNFKIENELPALGLEKASPASQPPRIFDGSLTEGVL